MNKKCPINVKKSAKSSLFFFNLLRNLAISSFWLCPMMKVYLLCSCTNSIFRNKMLFIMITCVTCIKCCTWDIAQNAFGQSNCRILNQWIISPEQNNEKTLHFTCSYKFMKIKFWFENFLDWHGQNEYFRNE